MSDTKDTELAPEDLDKVAGGVGHPSAADAIHSSSVDTSHTSHVLGGGGGFGGAHTK